MRQKTLKDLTILIGATLGVTFLIWLPFLLRIPNFYGLNFSDGFDTIYRNYDGLQYIVIAKSLYNPSLISGQPYALTPTYYASTFPGFSLLILLFSPLLGFLKSMIFISVLSTIGSASAFYFLVKHFKLSDQPLWLSLLFLVLPARWLIVHSVGSAEPLFIFFTIVSIYFFMKYEQSSSTNEQSQKWRFIFSSSLFGLLATLTRPPGILLFVALSLYLIWKGYQQRSFNPLKIIYRYSPLLLIPIGLLAVFLWFGMAYHDFFAYFHSGDNIHLAFPPFQVFNKNQPWVGEIWLEDIVYIFLLGFLGMMFLFKEKLYPMAFYVLTYLLATIMVAHRDISRYSLPVFPFVLIAFQKLLISKEFKIVMIIIALAIYLYSQNFIINNTAPVADLQFFN